ncbi:MAG: hypothetical protein WB715_21665 [Roseiarcus sp.]|uniref:hypothetical protein n=1 Tax=Roseiarcus sp. TaxID=1969460 RepID=UPI003C3184E7
MIDDLDTSVSADVVEIFYVEGRQVVDPIISIVQHEPQETIDHAQGSISPERGFEAVSKSFS